MANPGQKIRVAIGADHRGYRLKEVVKEYLISRGTEVTDLGTDHEVPPSDYPDIAFSVCRAVAEQRADFGILACLTGLGMCIAANKVKGIRAAIAHDTTLAEMARKHNNANVLCLQAGFTEPKLACEIARVFLHTEFEGGRHIRRINKILEYEGSRRA